MLEAEAFGMECLPGHRGEAIFDKLFVFVEGRTLEDAVAAVPFVAEQGVSLPLHVDADLVCAARFEATFNEGYVTVAFQHPVVGHGVLAVRAVFEDPHLLPVFGAAADVAGNGAFVLLEISRT